MERNLRRSTATARETGSLTPDTMFDALSDEHRRYALYYLTEQDAPVGLNELTEQVAARATNAESVDLSDAVRERIHIALYHTHLPKLTDLKLVTYDERDETFSLSDDVDFLDDFLVLARRVESGTAVE